MDESGPAIGRLQPVAPREVWPHEALNFTPWLLENADVLSEVLHLDLDLEAAEHAVGGFSLDLIGTDRISGARVIVENQLEVSDHTHLGQIMTYAGGADAANIVWVASAFRAEHRRALEWLNERTDEETRFFAVKVEAVRIGDSAVAPLLTLEVQPNDWGKQVRATAVKQASGGWGPDDLLTNLAADGSEEVAAAVSTLIEAHSGLGTGTGLYWGSGRTPSVTATMAVGRVRIQPWSVYCDGAPGGGPVWAINFDWIHKQGRGLPVDVLERVVAALEQLPGLSSAIVAARSAGWRKRPSIPAVPLFADAQSLETIEQVMRQIWAELNEVAASAPPAEAGPFDWTRLHELMRAIPAGRWTTYGELAQLVGTAAQPLGQHITRCFDCPNAHRVLASDGLVSERFSWPDPQDDRDPVQLLRSEGVEVIQRRASSSQRISASELAQRARSTSA